MSDTKLDTRSLSAEEEAILDACFRGNIHDLGSAIVCYGRALFGQGESEAADPMASWGVWRCECCAAVANPADSAFRWNGDCWQHHHAEAQTHFDCQFFGPCPRQRPEPAQPEPKPEPAATDVFATDRAIGVQAMNAEDVPAATEMPEAVRKVCHRLRHLAMTSAIACRIGDRDEFDEYADALESWWRTHAQPVANVASEAENAPMSPETERVLLARQLLKTPASEPGKVECPNCGHGDDWSHGLGYNGACMRREKPAPPEPAARVDTTKTVAYCDELDVRYGKPAAPEMPAPIFYAIADLRRANYFSTAASLETFWSAQATAPKKLEKVDPPACNTSGPLRLLVKLIKSAGVANLTNGVQLGAISWSVKMTDAMQWADAAIAELDAYERGGREGK